MQSDKSVYISFRVREKGAGNLIISHEFRLIQSVCDSVLFLQQETSSEKINTEELTNQVILNNLTDQQTILQKLEKFFFIRYSVGDNLFFIRFIEIRVARNKV